MASAKELLERLTIREIVENWALLRDARRWDRMDIHAPRCLNMGAISHGGTIMKKLSMLGIVGGAALLAAVPFSLASDNILVRFTVGITRPAQTIPLLHRRSVLLLTHLVGPN